MISASWLRKVEIFETLGDLQLNGLLARSTLKSFQEGVTIFRQGETAESLYVLVEGVITMSVKTDEGLELMTSTIEKEGAAFGMPSLIKPFRYNVDAACSTRSTVLIIDASGLRTDMDKDPRMGMGIMERLAFVYFNRLNEMRRGISKLVHTYKGKGP